jgi:alpha-mannosidase
VRIRPATAKVRAVRTASVTLSYDRAVTSRDGEKSSGGFAADGGALPAEMLPAGIDYAGVHFAINSGAAGTLNAVTAHGQAITLPAGSWTRAYVVAASAAGDQAATFSAGSVATNVTVEDWGGFVGQWDDRTMKRIPGPPPTPQQLAAQAAGRARADSIRRMRVDSVLKAGGDTLRIPPGRGGRGNQPRMIDAMDHLSPGYIKPADIIWFASHHHDAAGANQYYSYSYLFAYPIDVPAGATSIVLPNNDKIRILAISVANEPATAQPAAPLYDTLGRTRP